jgi:hypothetical protein
VMGLEGVVSKKGRFALQVGALAALAQGEESGQPGRPADRKYRVALASLAPYTAMPYMVACTQSLKLRNFSVTVAA